MLELVRWQVWHEYRLIHSLLRGLWTAACQGLLGLGSSRLQTKLPNAKSFSKLLGNLFSFLLFLGTGTSAPSCGKEGNKSLERLS